MSNRLIVFDLDGVLIDSREIHFNALNLALLEFGKNLVITREEQDHIFEGLTTKAKLSILTQMKGLPESFHQQVWDLKQEYSASLFSSVSTDQELANIMKVIRFSNIHIAVASNSIRKTLDGCLKALGVYDLVEYSLSNEDVDSPKPSSEIYSNCMEHFNTDPNNTVIFEDSQIGITAALTSGATVEVVKNRADLSLERMLEVIGKMHEA